MTSELLASIAGILLSLLFSYVPGLNEKYAALDKQRKSLIMLGLLVLAAAGVFGLSCAKWVEVGITCDEAGAIALVKLLVAAVVANQATYLISPEPAKIRAAKASRG